MSSNHTNNMWHKLILQSQEDIYHWCSCNNSFCNLLPLRYFGQITVFLINNVSLQASIISLILWSQNTSQKIKGSYKYSHDIYIYIYIMQQHIPKLNLNQHLKDKTLQLWLNQWPSAYRADTLPQFKLRELKLRGWKVLSATWYYLLPCMEWKVCK